MVRRSTGATCAAVSRGRQVAQRESTWRGHGGASLPKLRQRRSSCPMPGLRQRRSGCPRSTAFRQHRRRHGCRSQSNAGAVAGVLAKSPVPAHGLAAQGRVASAKRGVVFSWVRLIYLLRASCPAPFGPATLFARAPGAEVNKQKKKSPGAASARKLLLSCWITENRHLILRAPFKKADQKLSLTPTPQGRGSRLLSPRGERAKRPP